MDQLRATNNREAPYQRWAELQWLHICKGRTVDYNEVTQWFIDMVQKHDIRPLWVCYDAALSGYWAPQMAEIGFTIGEDPPGADYLDISHEAAGRRAGRTPGDLSEQSMLRWCLSNTAKKSTNKDGIESIQPVKCASNRRIDGMVSLLNAWVGLQNHTEEFLPYLR